jgi:hypothetical protein
MARVMGLSALESANMIRLASTITRTMSALQMLWVLGIGVSAAAISWPADAAIIWKGDFETGTYLQWHLTGDTKTPFFAGIPVYGRPKAPSPLTGSKPLSYYGDGSLVEIVRNPVREGAFAAKIVVKNAANGSEPNDCDSGGKVCDRRRTELQMHRALADHYNAMPYMSERWISASYFVPADWDSSRGKGMMHVLQVKPRNDGDSIGPAISIQLQQEGWKIRHKWDDKLNPVGSDVPWQQSMEYSAIEPTVRTWSDGVADFPNEADSRKALADFNKGGWTDWIINVKFDARGSRDGGTGFLKVWKRAGNGPWVQVLSIKPKVTQRGGLSFDRGIAYNAPASEGNNGGFDVQVGFYMDKAQVWDLPANRVIYVDNVKVADAATRFEDMVPKSSDDDIPLPKPPGEVSVE